MVQVHGGSLIKPHDKPTLGLAFTRAEFAAHVAAAKAGEYDDLTGER